MFLLPAIASGDLLLWAIMLILGALVISFRKLIRTISKMAQLELWAWFSKRHAKASKSVQKLIEQSSQQDLLPGKQRETK